MRRVSLLIVGLAVLLVGVFVRGNGVPTMQDQYLTTLRGEVIRFAVEAVDPDIDPYDPQAHSLRFVLLDGPAHGVLVGDLDDVHYVWPHAASVSLAYVPAADFVGVDYLTFTAVDSLGETAAAETIEIDVIDSRGVGLLAGAWDAEFAFDVQSSAVTAFDSRLIEVYRVGGLTLKGIAEFEMGAPEGAQTIVFESLRFDGSAKIGSFSLDSTVAFDPQAAVAADLFDYLRTSVQAGLFGITFSHVLYFTCPQTDSYQALTLQGSVGGLGFSDTMRFDLDDECGFVFSHNDAQVRWRWCDVRLSVTIGIAGDGFDNATLSAVDVPVPWASWLPGDLFLDAAITFQLNAKELSLSLDWNPPWIDCLRVLGGLLLDDAEEGCVEAVWLYGLILQCDVAPGVRIKSATSFDPSKNSVVTGQIDYFETFTIAGELTSCCGVPGAWSAVTYFDHDSSQLFDWGMTLLKADVGVSEHFSLRLEAVIRSGELGDPVSELTVGWTARW
jgi:hypothetical protein